jgi:hypothetical protein
MTQNSKTPRPRSARAADLGRLNRALKAWGGKSNDDWTS